MDVQAKALAVVTAHLRAHGSTHYPLTPSVFYHNRRVGVYYTGGPSAASTEAVLAPLVASVRALDGVDVRRQPLWPCGEDHVDELAAWVHHEGRELVQTHPDVTEFDPEFDDYDAADDETCLSIEVLRELLVKGERFTSACKPLPPTDA
jgi:hypothetical protein